MPYSLGCGARCDLSDILAWKDRWMWCATKVWVPDLTPEKASCSEIKDHIDDLVQGRADAHVLLSIQPT